MSTYAPTMPPINPNDLRSLAEWAHRELRAVGSAVSDSRDEIHYMTPYVADGSLSNGISANWKIANAAIVRCSTSNTITVTGFAYKIPKRTFTVANVGTGVLAFKNEGTESSASYRIAAPSALYQISAGHMVTFWYDPSSTRHRPVSRT